MPDRPVFFAKLLPQVAALRARTGRPHWLLIDEAHHLLPAARDDVAQASAGRLPAAIFITVHPEAVSPDALKTVETVLALGEGCVSVLPRSARRSASSRRPACCARGRRGLVLGAPERRPRAVKAVARGKRTGGTRENMPKAISARTSASISADRTVRSISAPRTGLVSPNRAGRRRPTWDHHLRAGDYSPWFRRVIR